MSDNNEYYAEKMRRLLENRGRAERIGLDNAAGNASHEALEADAETDSGEDFSFEDNKRPEGKPESFEEKYAKVKEAEAKARDARRKRKISLKDLIITAALAIVTLVLIVFIIYNTLFTVSTITVEGNEKYTDEQILASADIQLGVKLFSFSSREAEENIKMYCPEVEYIKVKRTPPGNIVITVVEEPPYYYADFHGEYRALTADLRVLGTVTAEERGLLIKLKLPTVQRAVAGEQVVFEGEKNYAYEVSLAVCESALCEKMDLVDLSESHNIRMVCDGKYLLKLEEYTDTAAKLRIAAEVLENEMFNNGNKASIDLSELSETGVIIDNQLELDW